MTEPDNTGQEAEIRNHPHRVPYEQLARSVLQDDSLSFGARGLWALMRSMPDDWVWNETWLIKASPEGRDALRSKLNELIKAGLLERKRQVLKKTEWVVYHLPNRQPENPADDVGRNIRQTEKPSDGKPVDIQRTHSLQTTQSLQRTHSPLSPPKGGTTGGKFKPTADDMPEQLQFCADQAITCWLKHLTGKKTQQAFARYCTELTKILADPNGGRAALTKQFQRAEEVKVISKGWASITFANWQRFGLANQPGLAKNDRPAPASARTITLADFD